MDAPGATEPVGDPRPEDLSDSETSTQEPNTRRIPRPVHHSEGRDDDDTEEASGESDEEEEDDEPHLKYAYMTKHLGAVYRNGDSTSSFLAAGDKMIIGTHNGNIHVLSVPLFQTLRVYHAHSASVTSISVSPFPPPLPNIRPGNLTRHSDDQGHSFKSPSATGSLRGQPRPPIPSTPSNSIYIATSSIDGNVCVASLVDPKDVLLRNFGRPVHAVALSPEYKSDRTFLSGGRAGDLILTTGGRVGTSTNSTTMGGAAAAASSWFGSMGLGANTGKDVVLHGGEGAISAIKWSLSGKYVVWVNEEGIKVMRSNLHLDSSDSELSWKRISHIDRPNRPGWEEMAGVWKARAEWVDQDALRNEGLTQAQSAVTDEKVEKLVVGWGETVWVIDVYPNRPNKNVKNHNIGSVEVSTILRTDCVISGISLYTPNLLVVLAYIEAENDASEEDWSKVGIRPGMRRRPRGQEPELRIIDIETKEEISADTLSVSRYQTLTSSDYHMCVLPPWRTGVAVSQRGALETLGTGLWDATMYPARLFSSGASIRSSTSSGDKGSSRAPSTFASRRVPVEEVLSKEASDVANSAGAKIFMHSPYDCVIALNRDLTDRLAWLDEHEQYEEAWKLIDEHPEAAGPVNEISESISGTPGPSQGSSLGEFFGDDRSSIITTTGREIASAAQQEKCRIGELWIDQLIDAGKWEHAAEVCGKAVNTTSRWEHWIKLFIKHDKVDEISTIIPTDLHPPLPSSLFEAILEHYVSRDRNRFSELINLWPFDLFDVNTVTQIVDNQLHSEQITLESEDWRILTNCLARLYLANGHYGEALRCYIRLQDADTAMTLIKDHRLLDTLSDDLPAFIMIRVSKEQMKSAPASELEEITAEPIKLLVSEAYTGIVRPDTVVDQLKSANRLLFLYFYLHALWRGESLPHSAAKPRRGHGAHVRDAASKLAADEGKALVDNFADMAVELFADYDRGLLMEFLQTSIAYSFDRAVSICESRHFTPELIYLLSKTGQTKRALNLILADLKDVSQAISFAKSQDDPDLWEDLLDYSMDKPRFIHGLLVEAGTSIDPIKLVRRIPSGLEIEGLREGLTRLIREHDLQASISHGAAKVLQSEVAVGMDTLRRGQRRGIKFNINENSSSPSSPTTPTAPTTIHRGGNDDPALDKPPAPSLPHAPVSQAGACAGCHRPFHANEKEVLVGFACGHIFHLSHVQPADSPASTPESRSGTQTPRPFPLSRTPTLDEPSLSTSRAVDPKVTTARLLRSRIGDGCQVCAMAKDIESLGEADG
ncbi:Vacuolar protein sorting-associated protein 41 [Aspergillus nanangensis]|uniref:Vacuolar protein sorting-associated protein 41 n=1 Tax=Aspergillus nanangensis TaxID=2582783 RepID=A0AAD4CR90_ASPNN|nr:Vacuolar protein sorting-associated protein 41 [Aspergillus nanangensis]